MENQKFLIPIMFLVALLFSCRKEEVKPPPEEGYPYTYYVLSGTEWNERNSQFQQINVHDSLSLNEYGFVGGSIQLDLGDSIDADLVIQIVDELIASYGEFLGISESSFVNEENDLLTYDIEVFHGWHTDVRTYFDQLSWRRNEGFPHGMKNILMHYFWLNQHQIGTAKFGSNRMNFDFDEKLKQVQISGNWFPELFIPSIEIYSEKEAVDIALESVKKNMENDRARGYLHEDVYRINKLFIPLHLENRIEIHECWYLYIPLFENEIQYNHYEVFVDAQTADILSQKLIGDSPY